MSDEAYRRAARAGLTPMLENIPDGPEWGQITATPTAPAGLRSRALPGWAVALFAAFTVIALLGLGFWLLGGSPSATPATVDAVFDANTAISEGETWWAAVIDGDIDGSIAMAHPDGEFNFAGLGELIRSLGQPVTVTVEREAFGSEDQPKLCFTVRGPDAEFNGALLYRQHNQRWLVWEVRPNTQACLVRVGPTTTQAMTTSTAATPTLPPVDANSGWEQLDPAPVGGRIWNSNTWTGQELIVWGGVVPYGTAYSDGAAFDPDARSWRSLAASPLGQRVGHTAVWTGEELIIWGGHRGGAGPWATFRHADGAAYRPGTDSWQFIADSPLTGGPGYAAVWTGSEMIVLGGNDGYLSAAENGLSEAAAYDPSSNTWRQMTMPMSLLMADAVWTGDEVVLYGVESYLGPLQGAAYDPSANVWRELPPSPIPRNVPEVELAGNRLVAWSYDPEDEGLAALDLASDEWQMLPNLHGQPTDGIPNTVALGPDHILVQSEAETAIYSFLSGEWHTIPQSFTGNGAIGVAPVWTGQEALFYHAGLPAGDPNIPNGVPSQFWSYVPDPNLDS